MEQMMSQSMPAGMRAAGLAMHQAASQFSAEARAAARSRDAGKAFAALSKVTQQCVACHSAYRVDP
jgi:mono/diheme cytochrome c family protein